MINLCGQDLAFISTALASEIVKGKTADEAELLGALFTMIGDAVTLISLKNTIEESKQKNRDSKNNGK